MTILVNVVDLDISTSLKTLFSTIVLILESLITSNSDVTKEGTIEDATLMQTLTTENSDVLEAIENINDTNFGSRTNIEAGLELANRNFSGTADKEYIILISDGVPNVGKISSRISLLKLSLKVNLYCKEALSPASKDGIIHVIELVVLSISADTFPKLGEILISDGVPNDDIHGNTLQYSDTVLGNTKSKLIELNNKGTKLISVLAGVSNTIEPTQF